MRLGLGLTIAQSAPGGVAIVGPVLTSISKTAGTIDGGTAIAVVGSGFVNTCTCSVGAVTFNSSTSLTVTTSAHAAGAVSCVITNPDTGASGALSFTYLAHPVASAIAPTHGPAAGATAVTITCSGLPYGLTSTLSATIGGVAVTSPVATSATTMTCMTGAHASGATNVIVTVDGVASTGGTGLYTYDAAAFDPATIDASAALWFKPGAGLVGSVWTDQIGGTIYDLTGTPTTADALNSIAGLTYDGATQKATARVPNPAWFSRTAGTMFFVVRPIAASLNSGAGYGNNVIFADGAGYFGVFLSSAPALIPEIYDSNDRKIVIPVTLGTAYVVTMRWDGTSLYATLNGTDQTPVACTGSGSVPGIFTVGFSAAYTHYGNATLWDWGAYSTKLTDSKNTALVNALNAKYAAF
jgi:hypothetical protein